MSRLALLAAAIALALPGAAAAQTSIKDRIVGSWTMVDVVGERADGSKSQMFGTNPKGIIIFTREGHFALIQLRAELPRIAANDRAKATPEEAAALVGGSIAYYGTYTVDEAEKSLAVTLEASTYPNLLGGAAQKRLVTSLTADELAFTNPRTPAGVTLLTTWKRAKAP
jgi:hypothetical protein